MFQQLFHQPHVIRRHLTSPLLASRLRYLTHFIDYLRKERGLSELTIQNYCYYTQIFLNHIFAQGLSLATITINQIDALIIQEFNKGCARGTIQNFASSLRAFLRYAQSRGWCQPHIPEAIKSPRIFKHTSLPSSPTWEEVKRLIKTTRGNNPTNIRDRALLLLLATYGLRVSEVVRLRLEDIDWVQETIHIIRSKGGQPQQFPLTQTVAQAIIRYLKEVRPRSSYREIFLTRHAPITPLARQTLSMIVKRRWKPLNVQILHSGAHSLRHACATRLINHGVSLKAIADQLGHRNLETTRIYAKVDLTQLRKVANINIGGLL
ncbi:MAG: site-specific integrase [Endomicrobiales bacterium]|jgi:site-specific recombinase XerD